HRKEPFRLPAGRPFPELPTDFRKGRDFSLHFPMVSGYSPLRQTVSHRLMRVVSIVCGGMIRVLAPSGGGAFGSFSQRRYRSLFG
ncbi:MAG: hypothetical protein ACKO23_11695, partial [Gemmataceae bacterium]